MCEPLAYEADAWMQATVGFTEKEDILRFIAKNGTQMLNLCHIPEDGRLKTLSFAATEKERVEEILDRGERVDGSSLFSFLEPGRSDIYISPNLDRVFINPFSQLPTLNVMCEYLDADGKPLNIAPQNVLARAEARLLSSGIVLKALAELEFYVISKQDSEPLFQGLQDGNYHDSAPFTRFEDLRNEILLVLSHIGIATKYGHSEVGRIPNTNGEFMEQQEIELSAQNLPRMAESIAVAKWAIRNICARREVSVSFIPKIALKHAGTGMHLHLCAFRGGKNIVSHRDGSLSKDARIMIGGILRFAPSLSAFANPTPVSYLRFIARKESPMHICWSSRNRLALIRIPLWPRIRKGARAKNENGETFEYRAPDAFANSYLLLAGLATAVSYGLRNPKEALKTAEDLHLDNHGGKRQLATLPLSCSEAAHNLQRDRQLYEAHNVFPRRLIDKTVESLESYADKNLWRELRDKPDETEKLLKQYRHYG